MFTFASLFAFSLTMDEAEAEISSAGATAPEDFDEEVVGEAMRCVKQCFLDEGLDEGLARAVETLWRLKLDSAKAGGVLREEDVFLGKKRSVTTAAACRRRAPKPTEKERIGTQVDGLCDDDDTSDEEDEESGDEEDDGEDDGDDDDDDDDESDDEEENAKGEDETEEGGEEGEPLCSDDDLRSEEDLSELFDVENVIFCQFEKIARVRNKWRFHLRDGIMNLNGRDYVFQRATGDAEW